MLIRTFAAEKVEGNAFVRQSVQWGSTEDAPVVQWIEWKIPVLQIRVRFPTGVLRKSG